jgi:hypothetical protein
VSASCARVVVSIIAKLTALETTVGLDWCIVAFGLRVHGTTLTSLRTTTRPLVGLRVVPPQIPTLIVSLTLLSRALHLIIISTLISRAELRTLQVAFKANCLVQQSLEVGEGMTLQLIVQWSN